MRSSFFSQPVKWVLSLPPPIRMRPSLSSRLTEWYPRWVASGQMTCGLAVMGLAYGSTRTGWRGSPTAPAMSVSLPSSSKACPLPLWAP